MSSNAVKYFVPQGLLALLLLAGSLASPLAHAQKVYRIVGADGKVTFSDQQPPPASHTQVSNASAASAGGAATAGLPFELRQIAGKYPVTLYSGENCGPCAAGRSMLVSRGIPFTERTVNTNEDAQTLQRMSGDSALPVLTIGGQQLKGFSDTEWTQFLNAAGYPLTSALPASYRQPAATPLVGVAPAPAAAPAGATAASPATTAARPARPVVVPNDNPAGIKF